MQPGKFPSNEKDRLNALRSYGVLDTLSEIEYDEITQLASQLCGTKIALISLIDEDRQWFKSKFGLEAEQTPREFAFCGHAINTPADPFIIEDSRLDERFNDNPLVVGAPNVIFYAGIPLVNEDNYPLGTLCVIDDQPKKLSEAQISGLKTLARSVMNLLELRRKNDRLNNEKDAFIDALEFNNPFYLILNVDGTVNQFGEKLAKVEPRLQAGIQFSELFEFLSPFVWSNWTLDSNVPISKLYFFQSLDGKQRFKFSIKRNQDLLILSANPVVNSVFPLSNYGLVISDFAKHDYIAEFLFLQQTTDRSLDDAKLVLKKSKEKNDELKLVQEKINLLARFPSENPNPIVRLNKDLTLSYSNSEAQIHFNNDFGITEAGVNDPELNESLSKIIHEKGDISKLILERNKRHYNISIRNIQDFGYVNIYAADITNYINAVQLKENQLIQLNREIEKQKEFYEFILNNIPSDIAVFDADHKYRFVNPQGIKDDELRNWMIGKDDYDYCDYRNLSTSLADQRREKFNRVVQNKQHEIWIDDYTTKQGERKIVFRRIDPLFDESGAVKYVIGYGIDITEQKLAEEKLVDAYNRAALLEKFLDRTTDAIQVSDDKGQMIYVNDAAAKRLGIEKSQIQKYRVEDFETYFKTPGIWEEHLTHLRKHGVFVVESQNKNIVTGDLIDVEISVTYEDISNKGYLIAASRDVSERKKAEYEIQKLSLVAKNTNNGVLILDADRKITWANEAMVNRSKYSLEELIGNSPKMFQYEGTDQNAIQRIYQNLIELKPLHEELLHKSKSGDLYWIDLNIQPIFDQNNRHIGYIAIEFDITDRKKFEETIAEQNKSLKEITDALDQSSLVSIADLNGNITKVNKKFCQVAQFDESELIGKNHNIINSGYHSKEFWVELWKTIKSGEIWRGEVKNKAKDGTYYWVDSIIYPVFDVNGKIQHYLSIRHEITDKKEAEENLKIKSVFQNLLMDISSKYINLPIDQLEESIDESLSKLGTFVNVDRVYVFDYNYTNQTASNLFEWCADGIKPEIDNLQQIPLSEMPVWVKKHQAGLEVYVPNVSKLEPGKFRELLEIQEIKSIITIPMMENGKCIGFVGFDSVREVREFNEDEKNLLRLYSDMLVNVNSRTEYIRAIENNRKEIEKINRDLELIVQEKTMKNLELAKSITDQEKLVMVGEIASGIAHDLNTPLGAIKSGAENIRFTLENIFKESIWKCSPDQIKYACGRAVEAEFELFVGGMQIRREISGFQNLIEVNFPQIPINLRSEIASGLVKARVRINETDLIQNIVNSQNPLEFLELIYQIQMTRTFVDTIISSGERASNVVQDLKSFIKDPKNSGRAQVDLRANIASVLNIFNYEIKNHAELSFKVADNLIIEGYDIRLFQLWSNLIKNALESIEETESRGQIRIYSLENDKEIAIVVENTGKEIDEHIKNKIFEKFFTTKANRNGSGLGLSIVKNVIEEHNARISVESDPEKTAFTIYFNKGQ